MYTMIQETRCRDIRCRAGPKNLKIVLGDSLGRVKGLLVLPSLQELKEYGPTKYANGLLQYASANL